MSPRVTGRLRTTLKFQSLQWTVLATLIVTLEGNMKEKLFAATVMLLLLSVLVNIYLHAIITRYERMPFYYDSEKRIAASAVSLLASREKVSEKAILDMSFPIVMSFPDKRCVELRP